MNAKYNFDLLLKKPARINYKERDVFKKAALVYEFDIDLLYRDLSAEDLRLVEQHMYRVGDKQYRLKNDDRTEILRDVIGAGQILNAIKEYEVDSVFTKVLQKIASPGNLQWDEWDGTSLYFALILADVFPERIDKDDCRMRYHRLQFFKPFEKMTENFAGRKSELETLNDYVDWMPKSSILGSITSGFRNIIDWHEKPPLLIKGIGGVGKSTIVSKFIMEQNKGKNGTLPFVYIDFDLPGFSLQEPMTLLIEALRQIEMQFPAHRELTESIRNLIEMFIQNSSGAATKYQNTRQSSRSYIYSSIEDVLQEQRLDFAAVGKRPILVVFDSFEEMQYRASTSELFAFYAFIKEVSERLPRLRPVFVGRAEINEERANISFDTMPIKVFDRASALSFLGKRGVEDEKTRQLIFDNFGGNPLMLTLATDLAKKEDFKLEAHHIKGKKWEYLITRILGHIHNDEVRKMAVPGMLVRSITPTVIQEVLSGPSKLNYVDDTQAEELYRELRKEVALISWSQDDLSFSFRQDLRMMCEDMIWEQYPEAATQIRKNAIAYYKNYERIEDPAERSKHKAEYFFHSLKEDQIPEELNAEVYREVRPYLESAVIEFSPKMQRFIASLSNRKGSARVEKTLDDYDWQGYTIGLLKTALNGELSYLEEIYEILRARKTRVNNGYNEFGIYEARVYQRLNKLQLSNALIDNALDKAKDRSMRSVGVELLIIKAENFEYQERYAATKPIFHQLEKYFITQDEYLNKKIAFLKFRIKSRLEKRVDISSFHTMASIEAVPKDSEYVDTKWAFIFSQLQLSTISFKEKHVFKATYKKMHNALRTFDALEGFTRENIGFFIKDVTNTGNLNIVLMDILFVKEIMEQSGKLEL